MTRPRNVKQVKRVTGCVAALGRFVARSGERYSTFFDVLKKKKTFEWSSEASRAFDKLKTYLGHILTLIKPRPEEELYLYLGVSAHAVAPVLKVEMDKVQHL